MATSASKAHFNESKNRQKHPSRFAFEDMNTTAGDFLFTALLETKNWNRDSTVLRASWASQIPLRYHRHVIYVYSNVNTDVDSAQIIIENLN